MLVGIEKFGTFGSFSKKVNKKEAVHEYGYFPS